MQSHRGVLLFGLLHDLDRPRPCLREIRQRRRRVIDRRHVLFILDDLGLCSEIPTRPKVDVGGYSQEKR